ncbi:MAG: 2-succinyl-5-enolpyruvyl-6-hydroxy-3-cyclohexene-1-carboxylic-acid synthase [Prevotella sp.]|nr:2-succinyl-5-enolpyruvyl-6-hydroxy-3-cyclohexene-1-carboxylic-acid synthase [Bacteroides sp.]MCM1366522.1 2-succinyl-5-enolpyruvyl-6-hydroxy-3-cyclohexene-1-carboxylic-acid synthase [Prevotella sp.]
MNTSSKLSCRLIASILVEWGIRDVVVSPGSRNTPLILAMDAETSLRKHIVIDERSAAFFALGISQVSRQPVALVCTSGSAPLNYGPALSEAFYSGIPLIAITADRPQQWIDQDDSQTIRQFRALENVVKRSYDLPDLPDDFPEYRWMVERTVNDALIEATKHNPGPVHINVQLDAPLGKTIDTCKTQSRRIFYNCSTEKLSDSDISELANRAIGKKILLVAGFMPPSDKLQYAVSKFSNLPNVAIMAETVSNLHLNKDVYSIDKVLTTLSDEEKELMRPDIVISLGGALISRQIKEYLRKFTPDEHWAIGYRDTTADCFRVLTRRIEASPQYLLRKLFNKLVRESPQSYYQIQWQELRRRAQLSAESLITNSPWCELKAFNTLFQSLSPNINLQVANGTAIRYNQLLATSPFHSTFCNRGVSGIDGCTSTALGAASASKRPTILITGDMAFSYDLSALTFTSIPNNFKIIIMDNRGGGIFRFINSTRDLDCREKYFCASPSISYKDLAKAFGLKFLEACDEDSLRQGLKEILSPQSKAAIIRIKAPAEESAMILTNFMNRQKNI